MISFENFHLQDGLPIYLQIILFIKRGIIGGMIASGEELPSRRALSALLGVNPNTIQKAYRQLEDEQLIQSHSGAKSYVSLTDEKLCEIRNELIRNDIRAVVSAMKHTGLSREEAHRLIDTLWEEEL